MSKNRSCALFLGCYIAERLLSNIFKNVKRMPNNNQGYDFICSNNYLIDVKSSCTHLLLSGNKSWRFNINYNTVADYFLCIAIDNRNNLNPLHLWLIPGNVLSHLVGTSISETTLNKWIEYEKPIDNVISCCDKMKQH